MRKCHIGFGLTGDRGGDTGDGAGTERLPDHGLLRLFLRYGTWDWAEGKRKNCAFVGILKDFRISMKTLSFYS